MSYTQPVPPQTVNIAQTATGASSAIDCQYQAWVSVHVVGFYTGQSSVSFQVSNDNVNWVGQTLVAANTFQGAGSSTASVSGVIYHGPIGARYFRLFANGAYTSGTFNAVIFVDPVPKAMQSGAFGVAPAAASDASASSSSASLLGAAFDGGFQRLLRTPGTFKTATATAAGDTALWTPTAGKKFRVMCYKIQVTNDAAQSVAGDLDITLRDATTGLPFVETVFVPGAAGTTIGAVNPGWVDLGNGYLSTAANNVLNLNLSTALTSGKVRAVVAGTEE